MGWSTTVVTPPDGDMAQYMASVRKLEARGDKTLYPTHGAPVTDPKPFLAAYLEHRVDRETPGAGLHQGRARHDPGDGRAHVCRRDKGLRPAASRSVLAHLIKLEHEGRVANEGGRYRIAA